jgi:hypothetical protein
MLVLVQRVHQVRLGLVPANSEIAGPEHLAQLVADQVDDRLKVELGGHSFLDAALITASSAAPLLRLLQQRAGRLVEQAAHCR